MLAPPAASQELVEGPLVENAAANTFILKVIMKKDSTEHMLKALITRTHAPKPVQYQLKHDETATECFLQYQTMELLKEAETKITGEKINGAPFLVEILEVEPQNDSEEDQKNLSSQNLATNLSKEAIKSITDMLKQKVQQA